MTKIEMLENRLDTLLRTFYALQTQVTSIQHDTLKRRQLENEMVELSHKIENLEAQIEHEKRNVARVNRRAERVDVSNKYSRVGRAV